MTSTSFNVGLNTTTRNSSKVLKPPGGGSSDIFGTSAAVPTEPQRKARNHLTSSIFEDETATSSRNKADGNQALGGTNKTDTAAVNGGISSSNSEVSAPAPTPTVQAPAPSAGKPRVPPGGFSSGLW